MKIKCDMVKNYRIKNRLFIGVSHDNPDYWWCLESKKWIHYDNLTGSYSNIAPCKSYKSFRRHIKRKCNNLPIDTKIKFVSRIRGCDWYYIKK